MATRTELLAAFQARLDAEGSFLLPPPAVTGQPASDDGKTRIVETVASLDGAHTVERHLVHWWDNAQLAKRNRDLYVIDPGETGEEAVWLKAQDPKPDAPEPSFDQVVLNWLRAKVGTTVGPWTVKHVSAANADRDAQTATARALAEDTTGNAWLDVYLSRDAQGDVQMEVLEVTRLGA